MVRTYRAKNPYRKASKLTPEQLNQLFAAYFLPPNIEDAARATKVSPRTVRDTFAAINDRLLSDPALCDALASHLAPDLDTLAWLPEQRDLSPGAHMWKRMRYCFFACPAEFAPFRPLHFRNVPRLPGHEKMTINIKGGGYIVTSLRTECHICPLKLETTALGIGLLHQVKTLLFVGKRYSERAIRADFLRYAFLVAINKRAQEARRPDGKASVSIYRQRQEEVAGELVSILEAHITAFPLTPAKLASERQPQAKDEQARKGS